jgi:hypothetical protein
MFRRKHVPLISLSVFLILLMAGCGHFGNSRPAPSNNILSPGDPLLGVPPVKAASYTTPPAIEPENTTSNSNNVSTTMPAPSSTTSPAALAAGGHPSLDATHDLRIPNGQPPRDAWRGQSSDAGIALNKPEPAPPAAAPPGNDPRPGTSVVLTGGSSIVSFDQAWAALRARGMTWSVLESNDAANEWKFACWIPNRQNPDVHRSYEASGPDPLGVLRAVLAKIDQDR